MFRQRPGAIRVFCYAKCMKAIIFDCFGVIVSDPFETTYTTLGGDTAIDRDFIARGIVDLNSGKITNPWEIFANHLKVNEDLLRTTLRSNTVKNDDLLAYIKQLRKSYKLGLLTNVHKNGLADYFAPGFLNQYFDVIVASGDVGYAKPEPQAYQLAAEKLGVRMDECIFVDDRQENIDGAQALGMATILHVTNDQTIEEVNRLLN